MGGRAEPRKGRGEDAYHHPAPYGARLARNSKPRRSTDERQKKG